MRRSLVLSLAVAMLAGGLAALQPAAAQPNMKHPINDSTHAATAPAESAAAPAATGEAPAPGSMRAITLRQIVAAQEKLVALAEAMPADKYGWRPGEGVRSVGEVFMHVASANFYLPTFWGAKIPAGVDPRNLEKEGADKAKTVAALKQSFDFVHQAITALPDSDLNKPIKIFGRDAIVAEAMLGIASHDHEHLGQAIAYARMNGVVPPWSAKEGQRGR
ncbi:MAG TPA: DinB family protein [Thermoanaerobaculia bacterium]|jgi:uncharacterized damage-inducible protein DinB|nr:DinB family protein [Thermoanaerobaculia bacterium]